MRARIRSETDGASRRRWSDLVVPALLLAGAGLVVLTPGRPATALARPVNTLTGSGAAPIPAFARMYGTACSTCHTAAPKLNVLGEVFRLNGYRMPENRLLRTDEPVSLGAPEWDEAWPRAIRSGDVPGIAPLAVRIVSDVELTRDERTPYGASYRFPHQARVLAGAPLGEEIAVFLDAGWSSGEGFGIAQARLDLQDPLPGLPARLLTLRLGLQNPYLLTFGDHHIDHAARQSFAWQLFRASELALTPAVAESPNRLSLGGSQAAVELNGLLGERLYYGAGLAQGVADGPTDANDRKDVYVKLRYKIGGLSLRGSYPEDGGPPLAMSGQLLDRSLILEAFGYSGNEARAGAPEAGHRAFGVAARSLLGRLDLGLGYVVRDFERPWPSLDDAEMTARAIFGRAEYLFLPWVIGSLKAERMDLSVEGLPPGTAVTGSPDEATRILPGVVLILRQNVRLVAEGDLFLRHPETERRDLRPPHALWLRLDAAF